MERSKILSNKYNLIYKLFNNDDEIKLTTLNSHYNDKKNKNKKNKNKTIVLTYNDLIDDNQNVITLTKLNKHHKK
jgi:mRNA-degrading endonuclease YafQ of YafQ-DinJ toxin-antitoxin module